MKKEKSDKPEKGVPLADRARLLWNSISGTAEPFRVWGHNKHMSILFFMTLMRGIAQVLFLDNVVVGFLLTVMFLWSDWYITLCGLICGSFNSITARVVMGSKWYRRPKPTYINSGLFVFNGYLSGATLAILTFGHGHNRLSHLLSLMPFLVIAGYLCCIFHIGITNLYPDFPVFSFPFVMAIMVVKPALDHLDYVNSNVYSPYLSVNQFNEVRPVLVHGNGKSNSNVSDTVDLSHRLNWVDVCVTSLFRGISQVWLHDNTVVGVLIVFVLAIGNYQVSMMALVGSAMSNILAQVIFPSVDYSGTFLHGIHGFNIVLTAVGVGCIYAPFRGFFHVHFLHTLFYCVVCYVMYLACITLMSPFGLTTMSLPFNLTSVFFSVYAFRKKYEQEMSRARREERKRAGDGRARTPSISRAPSVRGAPRYLLTASVASGDDKDIDDTDIHETTPLAGAPRFLEEPFQSDALQMTSISKPNVPKLTTMASNSNDKHAGQTVHQMPLKPPSPMLSIDLRYDNEITPAPPDHSTDPPNVHDSDFLSPPIQP